MFLSMIHKQIKNINMKKYLIAFAAFTIVTASANAQTKRNATDDANIVHHEKRGSKNHRSDKTMMMKQLNLSDAQKQQAKSLKEDFKAQHKQLEEGKNSLSMQDYQSKKQQLRKDQRSKFESILTSDQKSKMADLTKDQRQKRHEMKKGERGQMKSSLNLTDDQVSKLQQQHENFKSQAKAIKENNTYTEEQKKKNLTDLRKQIHESDKTILTAEQLQKKEEMRNKRTHEMKHGMKNKITEKS